MSTANPAATAQYVGAFFEELTSWGVHEVVISPGSRSTPLAMCAYELAQRAPERLRIFVDVDERGAAFFALGMAKASGRPTAIICTSGTAVANCYPAVLEAEASRVPIIVLTGDRPPRLQGLGAPQTCDQIKAFGDHVRQFRQMSLAPTELNDAKLVAFARQAAREAVIAAGGETADNARPEPRLSGACTGGPVHLNFPFEEPLKPDFSALVTATDATATAPAAAAAPVATAPATQTENVSRETPIPTSDETASSAMSANNVSRETFSNEDPFANTSENNTDFTPIIRPQTLLDEASATRITQLIVNGRTLVLAGEGTCANEDEANEIFSWSQAFSLPLLADPLSGLRSFDNSYVIDNYDTVLRNSDSTDSLIPEVIIRFGRWPVSKQATTTLGDAHPLQIVVDPFETRDFNAETGVFVPMSPISFVRSLCALQESAQQNSDMQPLSDEQQNSDDTFAAHVQQLSDSQQAFASAWMEANETARKQIVQAGAVEEGFEGAFVQRVVDLAPENSSLVVANSLCIRAVDTFYLRSEKRLSVFCNRGLNGIDGTVSTALGVAQHFEQTTLLIGDLALLHDINALALQRELNVSRETISSNNDARANDISSIVIVLLNNNGGGIFDMLPQRSDDPYFERLFLTPQDVSFAAAAKAFDVPYSAAASVSKFETAYQNALGVPGISLIEVALPLRGVPERYAACW